MKVLVDLNVVLDVILQRQPWLNSSQAIWDANCRGRIDGYVVATSLTNLFYIARLAGAALIATLLPDPSTEILATSDNA